MTVASEIAAALAEAGFALVQGAADEELLRELEAGVANRLAGGGEPHSKTATYGVRGLLGSSAGLRAAAGSPALLGLAEAALGPGSKPVKGIFFDKTPAANWLVPWHQDLTITVRERRDVAGFGPWSVKDGLPHVQPPAEFMASLVALRIHLDDAGVDNGALRVLPGTHARGRLSSGAVARLVAEIAPVTCAARRGDVLLMRPLLLHASSPSAAPRARRVVHLEYAAQALPGGLEWGG